MTILRAKQEATDVRGNRLTQGVQTLLIGVSQIFFQGKAFSGLLLLCAFAVNSWQMALLVVLGSASSSLAGALLRVPEREWRNGLHGFCGALVGAAAYVAVGGEWLGVVCSLIGGLACAPVSLALIKLFNSRPLNAFTLPYVTAPFCIVGGLMLWATSGNHISAPMAGIDFPIESAFLRSLLTNVSEVLLIDNAVAGGLILLALFVAHWKVGVAAVMGSALQSVFILLIREDSAVLSSGMFGYSGVLVAIAMAAVFLKGHWTPWLMAIIGALLACLLTIAVQDLSGVYTWPFVVTTWVLLVAARLIPVVKRA